MYDNNKPIPSHRLSKYKLLSTRLTFELIFPTYGILYEEVTVGRVCPTVSMSVMIRRKKRPPPIKEPNP